jgi:ketosteroid isomerase-like protein
MRYHALALTLVPLALSIGAWSCTTSPGTQSGAAPVVAAAAAATEDVPATITRLEKEWVAAIPKKDTATIDRLLADEFAGTSPTSHRYTKTNALDDLRNAKYVVEAMTLDDVSVNVYGNVAVAFSSQEEKSRYAGADTSGHYHFTDVWVKKDGHWQAVASHGTRYDRPAPDENPST